MRDRQVAKFLEGWSGFSRGVISSNKPNEQVSLFSILESSALEKYFLSPIACKGILRRAERRGKTLPPQLAKALLSVVESEAIQNPIVQVHCSNLEQT